MMMYFFSQKAATPITNNYKTQKPSTARKAKIKTLQDASLIKRKKARRLNNKKIHLIRSTRTWQSKDL